MRRGLVDRQGGLRVTLSVNRVAQLTLIVSLVVIAGGGTAFGQQVAIQTPLRGAREGYFESIGVSWSLQGRDWFARFGPTPTGVGFGPNVAGAGGQLGIGFAKGDVSGWLWLNAAQGCTRSVTVVSPALVVTPGWPGWVGDISVTPFVMGLIPVVGWAEPVVYTPWPGAPWWYRPYWWGYGFPYFPHLPPRNAVPPSRRDTPEKEDPPPPRPAPPRRAFPEHRREAFPRSGNAPVPQQPAEREVRAVILVNLDDSGDLKEKGELNSGIRARTIHPGGSSESHLPGSEAFRPPGSTTGSPTLRSVSSAERPAPSVAELSARRLQELEAAENEARAYFEKGLAAEREGKVGVAKVYFHMAARKSAGATASLARERLAALEKPSSASGMGEAWVAGNRPGISR